MRGNDLRGQLDQFLDEMSDELIAFRRDLHAHPEIAYDEHRTTKRIKQRLTAAGLRPVALPKGTGLIVDVGSDDGPTVALRADIDALPLADEKDVPYKSTVPGVCHACGHDAHATILLGTGVFLARQAADGVLPGRVRLIFQPAEELPGGALDALAAGGLSGVDRIFALHCNPHIDVGKVGLRTGAITAACDMVTVRLTGPGGHTARPHLTADLVYALGKLITDLPALLSRRVDPRHGLSLVWGRTTAGSAANAIPRAGEVEGTVRCLDDEAWHDAPDLIAALVDALVAPYGVTATVDYRRGVPPTINEPTSVQVLREAVDGVLGPDEETSAPQSLGGEDFAWYLESVPGALARLGTRTPRPGAATGEPHAGDLDIHRGTFDIDERAIAVGVRVMAATALTALWEGTKADGDPAGVPDPPSLRVPT